MINGKLIIENDLTQAPVEIGSRAPDFKLVTDHGRVWRLSDQLGEVSVLFFYPKNETLVCTKQLCSVRDHWQDYLKTKAALVGVSPGTISEHRSFAGKYRLPLPLLADENRSVTKMFGAHPWMPIWMTRAIVVIDAKGFIRNKRTMFRGFRPTDQTIITDIYAARADALDDKFQKIVEYHQKKDLTRGLY